MASKGPSDKVFLAIDSVESFLLSVTTAAGLSPEHAQIVARALVLADLRGVDTHGANRIPAYLDRIRSGVVAPSPTLEFVHKTPVLTSLDAHNGLGIVAATLAKRKAVEIASTYGAGIVAVRNSGHFGMAATYLLEAINQGYGAMVSTNASRSMPAWGSKNALLGTSPFAVGLPGRSGDHWTLDMSPSVVARGKIRKALRRGESIPKAGHSMLKDATRPIRRPPWAVSSYPLAVPRDPGWPRRWIFLAAC